MLRRLHVNVISGQNGSGKSAVMQALQCCFGATAKSTGRAAALHSFVKTGAHEAVVQVRAPPPRAVCCVPAPPATTVLASMCLRCNSWGNIPYPIPSHPICAGSTSHRTARPLRWRHLCQVVI